MATQLMTSYATGTSNTLEINSSSFVSPNAILSVELQFVSLNAYELSFKNI